MFYNLSEKSKILENFQQNFRQILVNF